MIDGARALLSIFKLRISVAIMLCTLAGAAVAPSPGIGPGIGPGALAVLALAVLLSSCAAGAFNQYAERDLDARMARTRSRPFVTGRYSGAWYWPAGIAAPRRAASRSCAAACGSRAIRAGATQWRTSTPRSPSSACCCSGRWPTRCSEPVIGPALRAIPGLAGGSTAFVLAVAACAAADDRAGIGADTAIARSQSAVGVQLDDHRFVDSHGRNVSLGELRGKPLVLSFVYTSCPDTCSIVTPNLSRAVRAARQALGERSFSVATIGFDHAFDTPEQMRMYAHRQGVTMSDWSFLSGDAPTLERLLDQVGFTYVESPRGYDHVAQTTVIDAQGHVFRQIYGDSFAVPFLVEPLKDLALRPAGRRNRPR